MIDFALPLPIMAALVAGLAFPAVLAMLARLPGFRGRNTRQFLLTTILCLSAWYCLLALYFPPTWGDLLLGHLLIAAALILYLEMWALLSTGYTLSILITLLQSGAPMSAAEIAASYRQGEGLEWIGRSRLGRIEAAGLVSRSNGQIALTSPRGVLVAVLYRICTRFLGLGRTG